MKWVSSAPANLALIKYMGKKEVSSENLPSIGLDTFLKDFLKGKNSSLIKRNWPLNSSLSFTLDHFVTEVEISEKENSSQDEWKPLGKNTLEIPGQKRFLNFFKFLKKVFRIKGFYTVRSGGNFPQSAGLASSASSFAALTLATFRLAKDCSPLSSLIEGIPLSSLAALSRLGSGSSCRSFFSPWSLWRGEEVLSVQFPWRDLMHQVIIVERGKKKVSSSEAHGRVLSSPLFKDRPERVEQRLVQLCEALNLKQWGECYNILWEEFLDMHRLFETSSPAFSYRTDAVKKVLKVLESYWTQESDGPLVTMDAGSSVHLLYRRDQKTLMKEMEKKFSHFLILSSEK